MKTLGKRLGPRSGAQIAVQGAGTSFRAYGNPIPYVAPVAVALAFVALAVAARLGLRQDTYAWYWSPLILTAGGALTLGAYGASRARGPLTCLTNVVGIGASSLWLWWVAGVPTLTWRPFAVYGIVALVVCGWIWLLIVNREGGTPGQTMHDRVNKAIGDIRNMNAPRAIEGSVVVDTTMQPGVPFNTLQPAVDDLAALYGTPPGSVKAVPNRHNAAAGQLRITPINWLAESPAWLGPSTGLQGPGDPMLPVVVGKRASGGTAHLWLPGDKQAGRQLAHILATGMSGAGKSQFIQYVLIDGILSRAETEYWYLDASKGEQQPAWIRDGAARVETTRKGVIKALRDLHAETSERARWLGERGLDQWRPGCGLNFRLVVADEFAEVANDVDDVFVRLSETLRSVGVQLLCGFQRVTFDRMPTSARSNFGINICFGVKAEGDAIGALPVDVLEAGAAPWKWGLGMAGMCYLTAPGVPVEEWIDECRTFRPNEKLMEQWARYFINRRGTAATPATMQPAQPVTRVHPAVARVDGDEEIDLSAVSLAELVDRTDEVLADLGQDRDDDLDLPDDLPRPQVPADVLDVHDVDPRAEPAMPAGATGMRLRVSPKMPDADARRWLRGHLNQLRGQVEMVKTEHIVEAVVSEIGYTGSWARKWLGAWSKPGPERLLQRVADSPGWYTFAPAPVGATHATHDAAAGAP